MKTQTKLIIAALIVACLFGIATACIHQAYGQDEQVLETKDTFTITGTMPDEPDVVTAIFLWRARGDSAGEWTVAGELDAGPGQYVEWQVRDLPDGGYDLALVIEDGAGNLSAKLPSFTYVYVDRVPPSDVRPGVIVPPKRGDMNGDGLVNAVDIQLVVNWTLGI
jgi:hypothetical protein